VRAWGELDPYLAGIENETATFNPNRHGNWRRNMDWSKSIHDDWRYSNAAGAGLANEMKGTLPV